MIRREYAKLLDNAPCNKVFIDTQRGGYSTYVSAILWREKGIQIRVYGVNATWEDIYLSSRNIKRIYF